MQEKIIINIAEDFTDTPGPRTITEGDKSGEQFRNEMLLPKYLEAKKQRKKLYIDFDGTFGYPPSFLEEAFGGLIRETKDNMDIVLKIIEFKCNARPYLYEKIICYMRDVYEEDGNKKKI